jgi:ankyrin repeat protein
VDAAAADGGTPLHAAAYHGHAAALHVLLHAGAAAGCKNKYGETPAAAARAAGHKRCVIGRGCAPLLTTFGTGDSQPLAKQEWAEAT